MATLEDIKILLEKLVAKQEGKKAAGLNEGGLTKDSGSADAQKLVTQLGAIFKPLEKVANTFLRAANIISLATKLWAGQKAIGYYKESTKVRAALRSASSVQSIAAKNGFTATGSKTFQATFGAGGGGGLTPAAKQALSQFNPGLLKKLSGGTITGAKGASGAGDAAAGAAGGGEALAGLAANPYAIAAGVVAALAALPFILESFASGLLDSRKALAEFSGSMAQVFAKKEIFETFQSMRLGESRAGSTGRLEQAWEHLSEALEPVSTLFANVGADFLAVIIDLVGYLVDLLTFLSGPLFALFERVDLGLQIIASWMGRQEKEPTGFEAQGFSDATAAGPFWKKLPPPIGSF
jgi:hypothetical protein